MIKKMSFVSMLSFIVMMISMILFVKYRVDVWETIAITFGTTGYHFSVRILVGCLFQTYMKNRANLKNPWYKPQDWESQLYRFMKVKKWKNNMPTALPELFDPKKHTWEEIAQASCQAELVHEVNMLLSFFPLLASIWFHAFPVFLITGICASLFDSLFVIIQRYNRPRLLRLAYGGRNLKVSCK